MPFTFAGCGAPGEPVPPSPPTPTAITDLSAQQVGNSVLLSFTLPGKSTLGDPLPQLPTVQVFRAQALPDGTIDPKSLRVVDTVPGSVISNYTVKGHVLFPDPISDAELRRVSGQTAFYQVRTSISSRKPSADSNTTSLKLYPAAPGIKDLTTSLSKDGILLKWTQPNAPNGESTPSIEEYRVYRGELAKGSSPAASTDHSIPWVAAPLLIATVHETEYLDQGFDYGKPYGYLVRGVVKAGDGLLESDDSNEVNLTPVDTFPPDPPANVVAAVLPGAEAGKYVVDLSWSINSEADLAGYRVYRGDQEGVRGPLLTPEPLLSPAYRDNTVQAGQHFWYIITAVDKAGNESGNSAPVPVAVP